MRNYDGQADVPSNATLFKTSLIQELRRFALAFTIHLLRFLLAREFKPSVALAVDAIVERSKRDAYSRKLLIGQAVQQQE